MDSIESEISDNLYGFYDHISRIGGISSEAQVHWSVIKNNQGNWPRLIYRISPKIADQQSSIMFSENVNSYPEVLIASDQNIQKVDPYLRSKGFYPFSAWKGMAIDPSTAISAPELPETIEIINPKSATEIEQWLNIVTSQLIAPDRLDKTLLESLIAQPPFFEAFLLKYKGIGVSTILVFKNMTSTGFYFIATEKSAQRQGFAKLMVQQILFEESQKSANPIVLHATSKGESLYSKLGFQPFNQFFLYRFINSHR